jgi:hypothetical protein
MPGHAPTKETLYAALDELRTAAQPAHPRHHGAWGIVGAFLAHLDRRAEADTRQETLIKVLRGVRTFSGQTPGEAVAWLRTVHQRRARDVWRTVQNEPVRTALHEQRTRDGDETPLVERLAGPALRADFQREARLDATRDALFARLERHLAATTQSAKVREMRRVQARVAWLRLVREADGAELIRAAAPMEVNSLDQVYKWVERGRGLLIEVLDAGAPPQEGETDVDDPDVRAALREIFATRRADAGIARPERRRD